MELQRHTKKITVDIGNFLWLNSNVFINFYWYKITIDIRTKLKLCLKKTEQGTILDAHPPTNININMTLIVESYSKYYFLYYVWKLY